MCRAIEHRVELRSGRDVCLISASFPSEVDSTDMHLMLVLPLRYSHYAFIYSFYRRHNSRVLSTLLQKRCSKIDVTNLRLPCWFATLLTNAILSFKSIAWNFWSLCYSIHLFFSFPLYAWWHNINRPKQYFPVEGISIQNSHSSHMLFAIQ